MNLWYPRNLDTCRLFICCIAFGFHRFFSVSGNTLCNAFQYQFQFMFNLLSMTYCQTLEFLTIGNVLYKSARIYLLNVLLYLMRIYGILSLLCNLWLAFIIVKILGNEGHFVGLFLHRMANTTKHFVEALF